MKIILDDNREFPKGNYNCVRTYDECVLLLSVFKDNLEFISLDYHLGAESQNTGLDVLVYMKENKIEPQHINIHSDHERGVPKMIKCIERDFPNARMSQRKL